MDNLQELMLLILNASINGVSIITIIANVVYIVKSLRKARKEIKQNTKEVQLNKQQVEEAFREAILPKTVKLDVSSKIEQPIKEGLAKMQEDNKLALENIHEENVLILKVLSQFSHVQKLSEKDQEKISDIANDNVTETIVL